MFWYADNEVGRLRLPASPRGFMLLQYYTTFMEQNSSLKRGGKKKLFLFAVHHAKRRRETHSYDTVIMLPEFKTNSPTNKTFHV